MVKKNNKYSLKNISIVIIIYIIAYLYCLYYAPKIEHINDNSFQGKINKMNKSCLYNCKTEICKDMVDNNRGETYFIATKKEDQIHIKDCLLTFWGFTHFLLYFVLALLVPSLYIEFFFIGVIFEIYEFYKYKCHDGTDIILNTLGILLGKYLSPF